MALLLNLNVTFQGKSFHSYAFRDHVLSCPLVIEEHRACYPVGAGRLFPCGKAAGAWSLLLPYSADVKIVQSYEGVSKTFRTGRLERELQMVQFSATKCSYISILWVSLVSSVAVTLYVASQRVFIVVVYFVVDSVRKLLDIPSYTSSPSIRLYGVVLYRHLGYW
jgi:hypothetical protein